MNFQIFGKLQNPSLVNNVTENCEVFNIKHNNDYYNNANLTDKFALEQSIKKQNTFYSVKRVITENVIISLKIQK